MTIILGIDPGSRLTGYGLIQCEGNRSIHLANGCFNVARLGATERLQKIYLELKNIIQLFQPQEAAIEQIFMHQNPGSALKLGHARGAAIVALTIPISEYSARQVKQSVVGYGAAKKEQVQHMVKRLLNLSEDLQADAADALAIALCHAHTRSSQLSKVPRGRARRKNTWRSFRDF